MSAKEWIKEDESAKEMLSRVGKERPCLVLPPLHKVPLLPGNVVEIVGSSPSAKTHILMQVAIHCILPTEYGGLGSLVLFLDLDCRFDILRFSQLLKFRIAEAHGSLSKPGSAQKLVSICNLDGGNKHHSGYDEELLVVCMRRFLYIRCNDSLEVLATIKIFRSSGKTRTLIANRASTFVISKSSDWTLSYQIEKEKEAQGVNVHFLMIDSIGALYWVDRASTSFHVGGNCRPYSLQNVTETIVQEIKKLLLMHPLLVVVTKSIILGDRHSGNDAKWNCKRPCSLDRSTSISAYSCTHHLQQEYMPFVWQSFVTHRVLIQMRENPISTSSQLKQSLFSLEWLLPHLDFVDNFIVNDSGVFCI